MKLTLRKYQTDDDHWKIRQFLREIFIIPNATKLVGHSTVEITGAGTSTKTSSALT